MWKVIIYDYSTLMYHEELFSGTFDEACEYAMERELSDLDLHLLKVEQTT